MAGNAVEGLTNDEKRAAIRTALSLSIQADPTGETTIGIIRSGRVPVITLKDEADA